MAERVLDKRPAFQFYTGDWLKDPQLSMCSPHTRGIWIDAICAMHELDRRGQITGTAEQLARLCRCTPVEFVHAVTELRSTETALVTERNGILTLSCRRMFREYKSRLDNAERQTRYRRKRGGQPVSNGVSRESNTPSSSSSSPSGRKKEKPSPFIPQEIPASLDSPEFRQAWDKWCKHRVEIKKRMTPTHSAELLSELESMGTARAIAAINFTVAKGWTGLQEPSNGVAHDLDPRGTRAAVDSYVKDRQQREAKQ